MIRFIRPLVATDALLQYNRVTILGPLVLPYPDPSSFSIIYGTFALMDWHDRLVSVQPCLPRPKANEAIPTEPVGRGICLLLQDHGLREGKLTEPLPGTHRIHNGKIRVIEPASTSQRLHNQIAAVKPALSQLPVPYRMIKIEHQWDLIVGPHNLEMGTPRHVICIWDPEGESPSYWIDMLAWPVMATTSHVDSRFHAKVYMLSECPAMVDDESPPEE